MDVFGKALNDYWKGDHKTKGFYVRDDELRLECDMSDLPFVQFFKF